MKQHALQQGMELSRLGIGPPIPGATTSPQTTAAATKTTGIGTVTTIDLGSGTTAAALNQQALQQRIEQSRLGSGPPIPGAATSAQSAAASTTTTGIGTVTTA